MHKKKHHLLILSLLIFVLIGAGCTPNAEKTALKDEQGNTVSIVDKDKPTLIFFFTGVG
jgi:hypothetical protein